ncbi:Na/Pi cotransporter family protein [Chlorobium limicola]
MNTLNTIIAALSAIVLFLYGLEGFSRELQSAGAQKLQSWLRKTTASRWAGFLTGALATAAVQSSSATTALAVSLVNASVLSFQGSLGILLGANVGTTVTAWLVSFKLTGIGPVFIVLGALISALPFRIRMIGKTVFYFGLIFFALDLIASGLQPFRDEPLFRQMLAHAKVPWQGVLAGIVLTALVQSSSVTTGLAILLVQQGIMSPESVIPMVIGANVGSTSTALIASLAMHSVARATAVANVIFNLAGLLLFLPFLDAFSFRVVSFFGDSAYAVAWSHLIFNLVIGVIFMLSMQLWLPILKRWLKVSTC